MTEEEIRAVLPSITVAMLFHTYGRLDDLLETGFEAANDDFYEMFWELIDTAADYIDYDYNEYFDVTKWYFSFKDMMEYYRLCRIYGSLHKLKLQDNPYMRIAESFVECAMDFGGMGGFAWTLNTKIGHKWASGIVFRTDGYFDAEYQLLEALLSIRDWYRLHLEPLRKAIEEAKRPASCLEGKAA